MFAVRSAGMQSALEELSRLDKCALAKEAMDTTSVCGLERLPVARQKSFKKVVLTKVLTRYTNTLGYLLLEV